MKTPVLSFVIPVYQKPPEVFRKTLEHLYDQSLKDIEVIAVFDGENKELQAEFMFISEERKAQAETAKTSLEKLNREIQNFPGFEDLEASGLSHIEPARRKKFEDLRDKRLHLHEVISRLSTNMISLVIEHGGASKARNAGMEIATGEFVVAWDADCYIKPHAAARWIEEFKAVPDADFVYTGYEISQERGGCDSESFDAYSLTCGNYISSMSPIRRAKAHKWDETLPAGQDWDYWLTAVERGLKGVFIEGSGFVTDTPQSGISSVHWSGAKRMETINRVREKHGITGRDIGVYSMNYHVRAIKLAKLLGGDVIKPSGVDPDKFKAIFNLGYGFLSRFENIPAETVKIQYWLPGEIAGLAEAKYNVVMETIRIAKGVINYCGTDYEKNKLADLGITAEVLPLPIDEDEAAKVRTDLPEEFSVLVATDDAYAELLKDIQIDLPHIKFGFRTGKIDDYSCFLSFYQFAALDDAMLIALVNGRHVISNVLSPYCGFVDPEQTWDTFKRDLYEKIREVSKLPFNADAQAFYKDIADPKPFREKIKALIKPELAVVS